MTLLVTCKTDADACQLPLIPFHSIPHLFTSTHQSTHQYNLIPPPDNRCNATLHLVHLILHSAHARLLALLSLPDRRPGRLPIRLPSGSLLARLSRHASYAPGSMSPSLPGWLGSKESGRTTQGGNRASRKPTLRPVGNHPIVAKWNDDSPTSIRNNIISIVSPCCLCRCPWPSRGACSSWACQPYRGKTAPDYMTSSSTSSTSASSPDPLASPPWPPLLP